MNFLPQSIPEVFLIEPIIHNDHRGYFVETFKQAQFDEAVGYKVEFVQAVSYTHLTLPTILLV